jgi:hypothetical protein
MMIIVSDACTINILMMPLESSVSDATIWSVTLVLHHRPGTLGLPSSTLESTSLYSNPDISYPSWPSNNEFDQGILTEEEGSVSTVDLLIKVACFVKS